MLTDSPEAVPGLRQAGTGSASCTGGRRRSWGRAMGSEGRWAKWRELLTRGRSRERWPEKDVTCPRCGSSIPAYYPMQMGLRREGLYVADPTVRCPRVRVVRHQRRSERYGI